MVKKTSAKKSAPAKKTVKAKATKTVVKKVAPKKSPATKKTQTAKTPDTEALHAAILTELNTIIDPEIGAGIVDIGLIYHVQIIKLVVHIEMTLTSFGCPIGPWFVEQVRDATMRVPGVKDATVEIVYEPAWGPEKMKPEVREAVLGY